MYRRDSGGGGGGRGGKSMENYLPNFSRASNTRMATFHLSFPLNVRSNVGNSTVVEKKKKRGEGEEKEKENKERRERGKKGERRWSS